MENSCDSCFYEQRGSFEQPCDTCYSIERHDSKYVNWVAKDFLRNVDEGILVMDYMKENLKASSVQGVKYDDDKPRWELLPFRAVKEVVEVLTYGSKKYADDNWKIVPEARKRYISAAFRHLTDWAGGEKKDSETGKSHLAHAICCLLFLLWFEQEDE